MTHTDLRSAWNIDYFHFLLHDEVELTFLTIFYHEHIKVRIKLVKCSLIITFLIDNILFYPPVMALILFNNISFE